MSSDALSALPFHTVLLDEAQTVKNAASLGAAAVRRLQARHRLCLTGTPLENHLGELWAQFDFLMPGYLGDQRSFQRRWRDPIELHGETLRAQLLAQRVRPFILRRRKADVATELPPRIDTVQRLTLEGRQKTLYESVRVAADELVRRALKREGFAGSQITILDALLKLRQVCCDPYLLTGHALPRGTERAKMAWLCDTLPALVAEGRRILVFSQFTTLLHLLAQEMTRLGLPYLMLTGETPVDARGAVVGRFQSGEGAPVLLISLNGYAFHIGLALVFFGYAPHIAFIRRLTGLSWPALPDGVMYLAAGATIVSLLLALWLQHLLRRTLLDLEPEAIVNRFVLQELVLEHISEGVIAIDSGGNAGRLTVVNTSATQTDMTVLAPVVIANWNRFNVTTGTTVNITPDAALTQAQATLRR